MQSLTPQKWSACHNYEVKYSVKRLLLCTHALIVNKSVEWSDLLSMSC